jgi:hypothetical protein
MTQPEATPGAEQDGSPRGVTTLVVAGVALVTAGQATAIAGILVPPMFIPGVVVIAIGALVLAAAGVLGVLPKGIKQQTPTARSAKRAG